MTEASSGDKSGGDKGGGDKGGGDKGGGDKGDGAGWPSKNPGKPSGPGRDNNPEKK